MSKGIKHSLYNFFGCKPNRITNCFYQPIGLGQSELWLYSRYRRTKRYSGGVSNRKKMRHFLIIFSLFLLPGCASIPSLESQCSASNTAYIEEWNCVKSSIMQGKAGYMSSTQKANYLLFGDGLVDQVKTGKKSDSQAKADLAMELSRTDSAVTGNQETATPHLCNRGGALLVCND
jgi:hypothetical protein